MLRKFPVLLFFVLLKFVLQFQLIGDGYELHRDEFLHLDQGRHLAWGYLSLPPFTSWIAWVVFQLGNSVFWVKFFPALFGALTVIVVWKSVEELDGGYFARILSAVAVIFSAILRINILFQPNSLDILCWSLLYYAIIKYIRSDGNNKWLWIAACIFGFGFLNKYNITFFLLGLLPALVITEHRVLFLRRGFYLAIGFALLVISPNLVWQYQHSFPAVSHLELLTKTQLVNVERTGFIKEQILFFYNSVFILIVAFIGFFTYEPFRKYRVFFWSYVFTISIYIYLHAKGYYAVGLYPVFIAFGSVYLERLLATGWPRFLKPAAIILPVLLFLPVIKIAFPIEDPEIIRENGERFKKLGLLRWEDGKDHMLPQDFADMLGWKELAAKVDQVYETIPDKNSVIVLCDNYGEAGAINYYSRNKGIHAVSMNADYIDWFPLDHEITNVIRVTEKDNQPVTEDQRRLFQSVTQEGQIENPFAREQGTQVFALKGAIMPVNQKLQEEINKRRLKKLF